VEFISSPAFKASATPGLNTGAPFLARSLREKWEPCRSGKIREKDTFSP
jgi:hypothetical protein